MSRHGARQCVPPAYLDKVLTSLQKASIVAAAEGKGGGYRLARAPDSITFLDVADAVEGKSRSSNAPRFDSAAYFMAATRPLTQRRQFALSMRSRDRKSRLRGQQSTARLVVGVSHPLVDGMYAAGSAFQDCRETHGLRSVDHLIAVADVLRSHGLQTFVVFAKLEPFTPEELTRIARVSASGVRRAIVLTDELEPWFPYRWAESTHRTHLARSLDEQYQCQRNRSLWRLTLPYCA